MDATANKTAKRRLQNSPGDDSKMNRKGTTMIRNNVIVLGKLNASRFAIILMPDRIKSYFCGTFFQSSKNISIPLSVKGCLAS